MAARVANPSWPYRELYATAVVFFEDVFLNPSGPMTTDLYDPTALIEVAAIG
ncbi:MULTISPECIES: hypothetical protein [unclassified Streptomyces]|uniref:hypothetical protein n=1 Tax=unclassified Streptomyces TaxID=2593676 RepID=UPI002E803EF7|nr:hypothetical protein [Streptomyces sp. NBC_00589]WTI33522.1 hypothetical protein OIC96_00035 [Streptomyces sp. NBC_00775]WTI42405.1 hypothetical protein OIC96_49695 [Streptomyces sp. NBC_00775]WUB23913.1 hypothetical protein OHA51_00035 [Streptomyces sp. NBC_00589]